jgi:hypothetical protein
MIDYISLNIIDRLPSEILENSLLDFICPINITTGELNPSNTNRTKFAYKRSKEVLRANLNGLTINIVNQKYINLDGSLHEYYKGNNYSQFNSIELHHSISEICNQLSIDANKTPIHNLEFGVNICLPFPVEYFLNAVLCCKGQEYEKKNFKGNGYLKKFIFNQYELKIYDKGKQYNLSENILRVEIKVTRMQYLISKDINVIYLSDLLNSTIQNQFKELLLKAFSGIVLHEKNLNDTLMTTSEKRSYSQFKHQLYWRELWSTNQSQYRKRFKIHYELMEKVGQKNLRNSIFRLISSTWDELQSSKNGTDITTLANVKPYGNYHFSKTTNCTDITTSIVCNNRTEVDSNLRRCKSCGRDISEQDKKSKFCSELKYGKTAKKCRNTDSNPRNNFIKREIKKKSKGLLFDDLPYIIESKFQELACKIQ